MSPANAAFSRYRMGLLLAVLALLLWLNLSETSPTKPGSHTADRSAPGLRPERAGGSGKASTPLALGPVFREVTFAEVGPDLFALPLSTSAKAAPPAIRPVTRPKPPPKAAAFSADPAPTAPPALPASTPAPHFPYEFLGRFEQQGRQWALVGTGSTAKAVAEGQPVDGQWRLESLSGSTATFVSGETRLSRPLKPMSSP